MPFDPVAGLSKMGEAVEKTAGAAALEVQKGQLEQDKIRLADELAGVRDEKQRGFLTSERVATQGFTSGENVLQRQSAKEIAQLGADATVKAAGIHAGGTVAAADISAKASKYHTDQQVDLSLRLGQKVIPGENGTIAVLTPGESKPKTVTNPDGSPFKTTDPEVLKGQIATMNGAYKERDDLIHLLKVRTDPIVSQINVLTRSVPPGMPMPPEVKSQVDALKAEAQKVVEAHEREATRVQLRIDNYVDTFFSRKGLINQTPASPAARPTAAPSLDDLYNQQGGR